MEKTYDDFVLEESSRVAAASAGWLALNRWPGPLETLREKNETIHKKLKPKRFLSTYG